MEHLYTTITREKRIFVENLIRFCYSIYDKGMMKERRRRLIKKERRRGMTQKGKRRRRKIFFIDSIFFIDLSVMWYFFKI